MTAAEAFEELVHTMHRLRRPGGCPWDGEQTHSSLKPYLVEEAYEVIEAIDRGDDGELCRELGDLLLQIVFHAEIAAETSRFTITDVVRRITEKLVRRHPHVFGGAEVSGAAEVAHNWSRIKAEERKHDEDRSALAGVPHGMPALLRAQRLGEKAAHAGFDWLGVDGVLEKLGEEVGELQHAVASGDRRAATAELGDLLHAATSLARHVGVSAEEALREAADRFSQRFRHMEQQLAQDGRTILETTAEEQDALWESAKRHG